MTLSPCNPGSTHSSVLEGIRDPENRTAWGRFFYQYAPYIHAIARRRGFTAADTPLALLNAPVFPADAPYPEAVFLLPTPPNAWEALLADLPGATFADLENLWLETCEFPRRKHEFNDNLRKVKQNPLFMGDFR